MSHITLTKTTTLRRCEQHISYSKNRQKQQEEKKDENDECHLFGKISRFYPL